MVERYKDNWTKIRAGLHFLTCGVLTAFFVRFSAWGFSALAYPFLLEAWQWKTDEKWEIVDAAFDTLEHLAGGALIGSVFYFTEIWT